MNDPLVDSMQSITAEVRRQGAGAFATSGNALNRSFAVLKEKEPTLDDLRLPMESADESKERFQRISKQNLSALLEWRPSSAADIGVEARWLRRIQQKGLGYASKASHAKLERLAEFFSLSHYTDLWREDLLEALGLPGPTPEQIENWRHSPHWKQAEKLLQLLDTGNFEHLSKIVDDLHELEVARTVRQIEKGPAESKTIGDFMKKRKK